MRVTVCISTVRYHCDARACEQGKRGGESVELGNPRGFCCRRESGNAVLPLINLDSRAGSWKVKATGNIGGSSTASLVQRNLVPCCYIFFSNVTFSDAMSVSDPASASDSSQPPADAVTEAKPTAMLAFMEEMRRHMQNQDRQIAALQQAVRAAPAGDNGVGTNNAVAPAGPPVSRETVPSHPTRSHDLLPFREDTAEHMNDFCSPALKDIVQLNIAVQWKTRCRCSV